MRASGGWIARLFAAFAVLMAFTGLAVAQSPSGIAIAQSAEEGFQACHGENADRTLACARDKCRETGAQDCLRVRWCYPAGFAGAMSYLANREITQVTFTCGAPSEAALMRMLAALCMSEPAATECRLMVLWDPAGNETERRDRLGKNTAD
ncbi:MAG: hypothetical protein AAGF49_04265 [Pseudomonadota bacterium]